MVYFFDDGEQYWICAENLIEAIDCYLYEYAPTNEKGFEVRLLTEEELAMKALESNEIPGELVSFNEVLESYNERDFPTCIASSVYC